MRQVVRYNLNILQLWGGWNVGIHIKRHYELWSVNVSHHSRSLSICTGIKRGLKMTKSDFGAWFPIICKLSLYWCRELWQWGQILVLSTLLGIRYPHYRAHNQCCNDVSVSPHVRWSLVPTWPLPDKTYTERATKIENLHWTRCKSSFRTLTSSPGHRMGTRWCRFGTRIWKYLK